MFLPFITPLLIAALFAFALDPYVSRFSRKKRSQRQVPTLLILVSLFLMIFLPCLVVVSRLITKSKEIASQGIESIPFIVTVEAQVDKVFLWVQSMASNLGFHFAWPNAEGYASQAATWVLGATTALVSQIPAIIINTFIFSAALYFFLTQSRNIKKTILNFNLIPPGQLEDLIKVVQNSSHFTLITTIVIGSVQALIVSISAWICGYTEFFIVFLFTFIMSLIPVIGAAPMAVLLGAFSLLQGEYIAGTALIVTAGVAGSIDNIIKPIMVSAQGDLIHPVISLVALIGAVLMYGFPGLLLGPVLTQLSFRIIPILYFEEAQLKLMTTEEK